MALRLFVVRHAQTDWNRERRYQGGRDTALSEVGRAQATAVARALEGGKLDAVYSSPLRRAMATAEAIAAPHAVPVRVEAAFREIGFGAWEGLTLDEARVRYPDEHRDWAERPHEAVPPGGEPLAEVRRRVLAGLEELRAEHDGGSVCLVTHGVPARVLILEVLGLELSRIWAVHVATTGISELEFREDWSALHRMNTLTHLEAGPAAR
jgi:broad specificity phosphatase PhoE